jgi:hypothetical protein
MPAVPRTPRTPKNARARVPRNWAPKFLAAFQETGLVTEACKAAGIGRTFAYERRAEDASFAAQWADVEEQAVESLEAVAIKRAHDGSDMLLIFLLKARRPDVYRDNHRVEHTSAEGRPISAEIVHADAREHADATREFLRRLAGTDG